MKLPYFGIVLVMSFTSAAEVQWVSDTVVEKAKRAVVNVHASGLSGPLINGFFVSEDGLVVTTASALQSATKVVVVTTDRQVIHDPRLMAIDLVRNVAVLATGVKAPAYLSLSSNPTAVGESCVVVWCGDGKIHSLDGKLLARRDALDTDKGKFLNLWSVALSTRGQGLMGSPVITLEGKVTGMCGMQSFNGTRKSNAASQQFLFAVPEVAITPMVIKASENARSISYPQTQENDDQGRAAVNLDAVDGFALIGVGDLSGAAEKYRSALRSDAKNHCLMNVLAFCLLAIGDAQGALPLVEKSIELAPEDLSARVLMGQVIISLRDNAKAIQYLTNLLDEFPKLTDAWSALGEVFSSEGRKADAVAAFKKVTELEPDNMTAWNLYADSLLAIGRLDEASKARTHASELESLFFKLKYSAPHRD